MDIATNTNPIKVAAAPASTASKVFHSAFDPAVGRQW
jgi:hypothetical protein